METETMFKVGVADALTLQIDLANKAVTDTLAFMLDSISVNQLDALISKLWPVILDNGIINSRCFHISGIERNQEGKYVACFQHRLEELFDLVELDKLPNATKLLIVQAIEGL